MSNKNILPPPWSGLPPPYGIALSDGTRPAPNLPPPNLPPPNLPPPNAPPPNGPVPKIKRTTQTHLGVRMKMLVNTYNEIHDNPQVDSETFRRNFNRLIVDTLDHFRYQGPTPLYFFLAKVHKRIWGAMNPLQMRTGFAPDKDSDVVVDPTVQSAVYQPPFLEIELMTKVMGEMGSAMGALSKVVMDNLEPQYHKHIDKFHLNPGMAARSDDWQEKQAAFKDSLAVLIARR